MSDISHDILIVILSCYFVLVVSQTTLAKDFIEVNQTNYSRIRQHAEIEVLNQTILDMEFFSYDVVDHRTLLVKFDLSQTKIFRQSHHLYDAQLYVSKIPAINYRINIGIFLGYYEKEIDATITDHLTFCLVLISRSGQTQTIFHRYFKSSNGNEKYIRHYCTKIGPDEERHLHPKKQGSQGDHILLLLQVFMIALFLIVIQVVHLIRNRKYKEWHQRQRRRLRLALRFQREHPSLSHDGLALLRFITIHDQEPQGNEQKQEETENEDEEEGGGGEEEEDSVTSSYRRSPSPIRPYIRYRSASPTFESIPPVNPDDSSIEHILEAKPWLSISH